jgi:hypothetical protein
VNATFGGGGACFDKRRGRLNPFLLGGTGIAIADGDNPMGRTSGVLASILIGLLGGAGQAADPPKVIATGDWSKAMADSHGYAVRGRLVLCEKAWGADGRREVSVYLELQDAKDFVSGEPAKIFCDFGKSDFRPEYKGGLKCELRDKNKKPVKSSPFLFSGAVPQSEWVTLPSDATFRLRASPFGINRIRAMAVAPDAGSLWVIEDDDANEYFLSGTFTADPDSDRKLPADGHVWRGTLDLPAVRVVQPKKLKLVNEWLGQFDDKKLVEHAPAKGYITSEAEWKKLWTAWRPTEELPAVDFTKHLVLVGTGGSYPLAHDVRVTDQGELMIRLSPRVPPKLAPGYGIAVIERDPLKTIQGKAIVPD